MASELNKLTIAGASAKLRAREITATQLTRECLDRIAAAEPKVHAFLTVTEKEALEQARAADARLAAGNAPALCGIPLGIKDIYATKGVRTTCASRILENFVPPFDATVIERLRAEGAIFVGKTNMDEFAMGSSTENSAFGATTNPHDTARVAGGSSGGSAAAVAAHECLASLGTDTGGSIREPASFCGVVGIKPTYSRVSRFGVIAFASSLDQVGPFTKSVRDAAILLRTLAGKDVRDSTCSARPVPDYENALTGDVKGLRIGVPREYFVEGMQPEVEKSVRSALKNYESLGASTVEISLPHTGYAIAAYYLLATAEASANLARYDGIRYGLRVNAEDNIALYETTRARGFGPEVKRRIMLGTFALSAGYYDAYYLKAQKVRTLIRQDFERAFEKCDLIVTPVAPTTAFKIGEKMNDPLTMYLSDIFTISVNLAGLPGMAMPCGHDANNLPIGMQLIAPPFAEETILRAGDAFERTGAFKPRPPAV
ncbi:Asp-tRNA(Asn)/Glu-tRNA(Gln) amidotransferase subunit GatA [Candidatus Binatus sp.]|uniref:Asp-tRNA(Asn)/Glu-tRNA(Gln) amidotransferase subunit GatA n=1 Tax=Candidatus Binatus sp. TaxID=2811406 RepID=UPI003BAE3A27